MMSEPKDLNDLERFARGQVPRDKFGWWKRWKLKAREWPAYEEAKRQGWLLCPKGGKGALAHVWECYCRMNGHPHCYALNTGGGYYLSLYLTEGRVWDEAGEAALRQFARGVSRHLRRKPNDVAVVPDSVAFHVLKDDLVVAAAQLVDLTMELAYPPPGAGRHWVRVPRPAG